MQGLQHAGALRAGYRVLRLSACVNSTNGGLIPEACPNLSVGPPAAPVFPAPAPASAAGTATPAPTVLMAGSSPAGAYMSAPAVSGAAVQPPRNASGALSDMAGR